MCIMHVPVCIHVHVCMFACVFVCLSVCLPDSLVSTALFPAFFLVPPPVLPLPGGPSGRPLPLMLVLALRPLAHYRGLFVSVPPDYQVCTPGPPFRPSLGVRRHNTMSGYACLCLSRRVYRRACAIDARKKEETKKIISVGILPLKR